MQTFNDFSQPRKREAKGAHITHLPSNEQLLQDGTVEAKQAPIDLSVKLHGEVRLFSAGFHL